MKSESYDFDEYPISFFGCGALISKNLVNQIGVYDENYFLYDNELDYAARCWDAGYKIYYLKSAVVVHLQSTIAREHSNKNILLGKKRYYHFFLSYSKFIVLRLSGQEKIKALIKWWINRTIIMIRFGYLKEYFEVILHFIKIYFHLLSKSQPIDKKLQLNYGAKSFPFVDRDFFPSFTKPKFLKFVN